MSRLCGDTLADTKHLTFCTYRSPAAEGIQVVSKVTNRTVGSIYFNVRTQRYAFRTWATGSGVLHIESLREIADFMEGLDDPSR